MARITVEDCLERENNRFNLVLLASRRAKQLLAGKEPVTDTRGNKAIVSALREIADGKVRFEDNFVESGLLDDSSKEVEEASVKPSLGVELASNESH